MPRRTLLSSAGKLVAIYTDFSHCCIARDAANSVSHITWTTVYKGVDLYTGLEFLMFFYRQAGSTYMQIDLYVHTYGMYNKQQQQPFYGPLSGTTQVSQYQKKHSLTRHPDHHPISISFFHLPRSTASSLFKLRAWQSFCTTSLHVLFGLPLGLEPSTSYYPYISSLNQCPLFAAHAHTIATCFAAVINIISSIPSLSLNSLFGTLSSTLTLHIHLTILISAR